MASNHTAANHAVATNQLAEDTLASINNASSVGRALYTAFMALTAYIIVALGTTDDLQFFDRAPLMLPLLNVEISLTGFYRYTPWLYVIIHANLLLVFSMIAEKHRYFAELVDDCAWPNRVHMRQQLHVNAFTQFLGADHTGLLALILKLMIWLTIGLIPPLLLLAIQLDFLAAQIESVTNWQQTAVLVDGILAGFFWNNILQKARRARFPKDWSPPFWKRYLLEGWVLWFSVILIVGFSCLVALVPLTDYERRIYNLIPERFTWGNCVLKEEIEQFRNEENIERLRRTRTERLTVLEIEALEIFKMLENDFNSQLVNATKSARKWKAPYDCSNLLTWWFLDNPDSWLNKQLETRRWLYLPDKVFVENRLTVHPKWLNRLKSELGSISSEINKRNTVQNTDIGKNIDIISADSFKTLDYFLPVNKEDQNFYFANFSSSFLPKAKLSRAALQGSELSEAKLQRADLREAQLQGVNLMMTNLKSANLSEAHLQSADLSWSQLQNVDLSKSQLQNTSLYEANLQGANLSHATMQGAFLSKANLQSVDLSWVHLHGADLNWAQLQGADISVAEIKGVDLSWAQLQGANLSDTKIQGAILLETNLTGVQFSDLKLDHTLILNPRVEWMKIDENLLVQLKKNSLMAKKPSLKKRLLNAIERMENAKKNPVPDMAKATLENQQYRCLLVTDNEELQNTTQHVCDNAIDPTIDPLIHLRNWAKYKVLASCKYKRFSQWDIDYEETIYAYNNLKDDRNRILGINDTTSENTSNDLSTLAYFFYTKQLIQIHQDKTKSCDARPELHAWYKELGYEYLPEKADRILNLKLQPLSTSMKH